MPKPKTPKTPKTPSVKAAPPVEAAPEPTEEVTLEAVPAVEISKIAPPTTAEPGTVVGPGTVAGPGSNGQTTDSLALMPQLSELDLLKLQKVFLDRDNKRLALENATLRHKTAQTEFAQSEQEFKMQQVALHQKYSIPDTGTLNLQSGLITREVNPPGIDIGGA